MLFLICSSFNLVHINQNSYFLDTLKASQMINDQVMMDGEFVFKNQDMANPPMLPMGQDLV